MAGGSPTVHGTLTALYNSLGQARTVNTLPLEQYVADTVPGESPSSWASLGGAGPQGMDWGFQELEAQAVAVRSYVLANLGGYGGYADTCDLDLPDLPRHPVRDGDEHRRGQRHRRPGDGHAQRPGRHHRVLRLDGWLHLERQPAVAVHRRARRRRRGLRRRGLQPQPPLDAPRSATRPSRPRGPRSAPSPASAAPRSDPGHPFDAAFGRVDTITLNGTSRSITIPGTEFYVDLGLKSDLFSVTSTDGSAVSIIGQGWGHGIGMGQWGALGLRHRAGQRRRELDLPADREPLLRPGARLRACPAGPSSVGAQRRRRRATGSTPPTAACSASATRSSTAAPAGMRLNQPVVGMASTHDAAGYWEVATDGGVFSFGDAQFHGSTGSIRLNKPMVGMAVTPDGGGYWLVASDGGIFAYGDAGFYGSTGQPEPQQAGHRHGAHPRRTGLLAHRLRRRRLRLRRRRLLRLARRRAALRPRSSAWPRPPTAAGTGCSAPTARVHAFGDAPQVGVAAASPGLGTMKSPMTGLIPDFSGQGFDAVNGSGQAFAFGDAPYFGDVTTAVPGYSGHAVGIAATPGLSAGRPRRAGGTGAGARAAPGARRRRRGRPR